MKKTLWILSIVCLFGLLSIPAFSQCATNYTYGNGATAGTYFTGYSNDPAAGGVGGIGFVVGAGKYSGQLYPMTLTGCTGPAGCQSRLITGTYRAAAQTAQGVNAWNLCPTTAEVVTILMWERVGEGASTHTCNFVAATARYVGTRFDYSQTMSPQNNKVFQQVPWDIVIGTTNNYNGTWDINLRINSPSTPSLFANNTAFKRQYYDTAIATPPVIVTGWRLYFYLGTAPTTGDITTGGWTYYNTVAIPDDANSYVDYLVNDFTWNGTTPLQWAVQPQFADGYTPFNTYNPFSNYFVGRSEQLGPTAAGAFSSSSASLVGRTVKVNWVSNVEAGLTGFQCFWSATQNGTYKAVGAVQPPLGNGHSYEATFALPPSATTSSYVKIKASKADGEEWSSVMTVSK